MARAKPLVSANITGDKALDAALKLFPLKFVNKSVRKQMRETMKAITLVDAKRNTPIGETGDLKRSLKVRTAKTHSGGRLPRGTVGFAVESVKTTKLDAYYAKWVFMDAHNRKGSGLGRRRGGKSAGRYTGRGNIRKGTRTLRNALYGKSRSLRTMLTERLRRDLPRIANEVRLATKGKG